MHNLFLTDAQIQMLRPGASFQTVMQMHIQSNDTWQRRQTKVYRKSSRLNIIALSTGVLSCQDNTKERGVAGIT